MYPEKSHTILQLNLKFQRLKDVRKSFREKMITWKSQFIDVIHIIFQDVTQKLDKYQSENNALIERHEELKKKEIDLDSNINKYGEIIGGQKLLMETISKYSSKFSDAISSNEKTQNELNVIFDSAAKDADEYMQSDFPLVIKPQ